jgi:diguanylate cyclase (GGDEF)-like protein/PAS domain S-box-containing protein
MKQVSLTKKLARLIVFYGVLIGFVISSLQVVFSYYTLKRTYFEQVNDSIENITPALAQSLWDLNFSQTKLQLQSIESHLFVRHIKLNITHFEDILIGPPIALSEVLHINTDIVYENEVLGHLTVFLDEDMLVAEFWQRFMVLMANNLIIMLITASMLYFVLTKLVTKRLVRIVKAFQDIDDEAGNKHDLQIPSPEDVNRVDEVDELSITLNRLWNQREQAMNELSFNEHRWRMALESSSDGFWDWNIKTGAIFFSDNWKNMLGFSRSDRAVHLSEWENLVHPDDKANASSALKQHFSRQDKRFNLNHRLRCLDGSYKWVLARGCVIERDKADLPIRMVGTHTDIDELTKAQEQLKVAAQVYQQAQEGMVITDANSIVIDVNKAFTIITGYEKQEVIGKPISILSSGQNNEAFYDAMWMAINEMGAWQGEVTNLNKAGELYLEWLSISVIHDDKNTVTGYVGIFTDITERKKQEAIIEHQANYDFLTHIANRRFFFELLERKIAQSKREKVVFWLFYLDLDHFKEINDALGHSVGDQLLEQWCTRLRGRLRESDIFARLGGDEFAILFCQVSEEESIEHIAVDLHDTLRASFLIEHNEVMVTTSMGIVQFPKDGETVTEITQAADQALYKAKQLGKDRHAYYTKSLQRQLQEKIQLTHKMRAAIANDEFKVFYQPIVCIETGKVVKAEALIRWFDTEGAISPSQFIPIAEETGLIDELTHIVIKKVIADIKHWQVIFIEPFKVSINISPLEFKSLLLTENNWFDEIKKANLEGCPIVFEITEGVLMGDDVAVLNQLNEFRDLGYEVAIDDFGTGYSSLAYLHKFDIDYLKIDKQFVDEIETNPYRKALCEAIIVMSHKLGLKVIAEGVEREEQLNWLKEVGCDYFQGFLCSKAISNDDFKTQFLEGVNKPI